MTSFYNVFGDPLQQCSCEPLTGWYRDGFCSTDTSDLGLHTVCSVMSRSFLSYSRAQGNDLITPIPEHSFPGLKEGDRWCLCASRWMQSYLDGMAPFVILESTNIKTLTIIDLDILEKYKYLE